MQALCKIGLKQEGAKSFCFRAKWQEDREGKREIIVSLVRDKGSLIWCLMSSHQQDRIAWEMEE